MRNAEARRGLFRALTAVTFMGVTALLTWNCSAPPQGSDQGILSLSIVDSASGKPTPARVELLDAAGLAHIAEDALLVGGD